MEKVPFWHGLFQAQFLGQGLVRPSLYMGYSQKVEGSSFPMVVVSGRMALRIKRNFNLKMGFFQTKNHRYWTTRWDNPTKIYHLSVF
jgi:hypothetical protein